MRVMTTKNAWHVFGTKNMCIHKFIFPTLAYIFEFIQISNKKNMPCHVKKNMPFFATFFGGGGFVGRAGWRKGVYFESTSVTSGASSPSSAAGFSCAYPKKTQGIRGEKSRKYVQSGRSTPIISSKKPHQPNSVGVYRAPL